MMEQKAYGDSLAGSTRDVPPAHYILEVDPFSQLLQILSETGTEKYESDIFEASGYKWKLSLYPNGDTERNGEGHISLYLVIAETESLPIDWEVKVNLKMFVFDQLHGTYSIFQDVNGKQYNFDEYTTEYGFAKLLPLSVFKDPSNGFLIHDKCVFGVEVCVYSGRGECFSSKQFIEAIHTWRIDCRNVYMMMNVLAQMDCSPKTNVCLTEDFALGNRAWAIEIHSKGELKSKGNWLSLFLKLKDTQMKGKAYVNYRLRIRDQLHGNHMEKRGKRWFDQSTWGFPQFLELSDLCNISNGYLVKNILIVELEIISISCAEKFVLTSE